MSQTWTIDDIIPASTSPAGDISKITASMEALRSCFKGSSRPSDITDGQLWVDDDHAANTWALYMAEGAADILIGVLNTSSNSFTPANTTPLANVTLTTNGSLVAGNGSAPVVLAAPTADGQRLTANLSAPGKMEWSNASAGGGELTLLTYQTANNSNGMTLTAGAWNGVPLNTAAGDGLTSLNASSGNFTFNATGDYSAEALAKLTQHFPSGGGFICRLRLRNHSAGQTVALGLSQRSDAPATAVTLHEVVHLPQTLINVTNTSHVHQLQLYSNNTPAFGSAVATGENEVWAALTLRKEG